MPKKKSRKQATSSVNIIFPNNMGADEMKHIIADGLMEFEERKKQREEADRELRQKEWWQTIGIRDFSEVKGPKRWLLECSNFMRVVFKISFISEKQIKGEGISFGIMQMLLAKFFSLLNGVLLMCALILLVTGVVLLLSSSFLLALEAWMFGFLVFIYSRLFRIANFEIMNTKNHNYLFGLFACVTSIISIVIAVATLFAARQ